MTDALARLAEISDWQKEYVGRQYMQTAVLRWAVEHRDAINRAGLADSLLAAMDAELAVHAAARPSAPNA